MYKATCLHSGLRVALKVYSLDRVPSNLVHTLVREVRIHADLQHRSIIALYGVFQVGEGRAVWWQWGRGGQVQRGRSCRRDTGA